MRRGTPSSRSRRARRAQQRRQIARRIEGLPVGAREQLGERAGRAGRERLEIAKNVSSSCGRIQFRSPDIGPKIVANAAQGDTPGDANGVRAAKAMLQATR